MNSFQSTPNPVSTTDNSPQPYKESSVAEFQADVIEPSATVPVLVDFWAPWCGPCVQLGPALEKVVAEQAGKMKLVKINIDENQSLASQMGVRSIPAVFAFSGGQPIDGFMGALPESEIRKFVEKVLQAAPAGASGVQNDMNAQIEQALEAANAAKQANEPDQAINIYRIVLEQMPEHTDALIGLSQAFILVQDLDQARQTLDIVPQKDRETEAYMAASTALSLAVDASKLGDAAQFETRLINDPNDHQARLDLASLLAASGDREQAVFQLLEIIRRDREWNQEAGRTKLLEYFSAWGPADAASIAGRKQLSRLLFS